MDYFWRDGQAGLAFLVEARRGFRFPLFYLLMPP